jgi:glycosyltransferase involved in cell wall biosynthesis
MDSERFRPSVVSITKDGPIGRRIAALGIPVYALGLNPRLTNPFALLKLGRVLQIEKPSLIQTWLYHADLIGGLTAKLAGNIPVIWNIRHSTLDPSSSKLRTRRVVKVLASLSRYIPAKIISCSNQATRVHTRLGYQADKITMIPNGFNLQLFNPNPETRAYIRGKLNVPLSSLLIGMVARFDPQKDHANFIAACGLFSKLRPDAHFLLCGKDCDWNNQVLTKAVDDAGLRQYFHLIGEYQNMPELYSGLDIFSLSSYSEAFPNVIGEAMACSVPCVVTNAGDSAEIVGDTGLVVPSRNPQALAEAWEKIFSLPVAKRQALGVRARKRIHENYNLEIIAQRYANIYEQVIDEHNI